jgi:hypothetical protein
MVRKNKWDVFISYASEDKEQFVKPLAQILDTMGVVVWYDEFSLENGDSLSSSIDRGLSNSKYGIVVISKAFITKNWPKYELQGLIARQMAGKKKSILPIWHDINRKEVTRFSPSLADKVAFDTSRQNIYQIAGKLIEIIRPDIYENYQRQMATCEMLIKNIKHETVPLSDLHIGPIRHETLPDYLLIRLKLIHELTKEVNETAFDDFSDGFRRDMHPEIEVLNWEKIALAYFNLTTSRELKHEQKREIYYALIFQSMGNFNDPKILQFFHYVTPEMIADTWETVVPKIPDSTTL